MQPYSCVPQTLLLKWLWRGDDVWQHHAISPFLKARFELTAEESAMGSFYVNFTVKTHDASAVANTLRQAKLSAIVCAVPNADVVVFEEQADTQDFEAISTVGTLLSKAHQCPTLAVLNHDDDILCYWLFEDGKVIDIYNSAPDYFDEAAGDDRGGNPDLLASVLGRPSAAKELQRVLYEDEFTFALEQHDALIAALSLPKWTAGGGFAYISDGELPDGLEQEQILRVP